jgi:predicted dehydrogenase
MPKTQKSESDYSLQTHSGDEFPAPVLPYLPPKPKSYHPKIGLIGCGGITKTHLSTYKKQGFDVVALCDKREQNARDRQEEFFPDAAVFTDPAALLARDDIEVVDIATYPNERVPVVRAALEAGKHVLSQKPFVLDLDTGEELVALADSVGRKLAVNQNGRWAPHFAYIREAIRADFIGETIASHLQVHWDHTWVADTAFEKIEALVLYDFAIHWFDATHSFWGGQKAQRVFATKTRVAGQIMAPPMAAQVLIEYEHGQASLVFDAHQKFGALDASYIGGTKGTLTSSGPNLGEQKVTLFNKSGHASPDLQGTWFPDGFAGTMGELLCAIEENREPQNSARDNLSSLALCFAAIQSSFDGQPHIPGEVRALPLGAVPAK